MSEQLRHWIERSRSGDAEAFSRIVDRFQAKVSAVTFSMTGNLQESEDIAQETFLVAWKKLDELVEPEKIGAWLCGIARILCKKCFDRRRRDPLHAAADLDAVSETNKVEADDRRQELARLAWSAIEDIPETYREPLVLFYRDGRSIRDVAETLQLTEDCVKQRLHRGRQYLRKEMERTVETALESTRPDTAFTLAVLASIPLAATSGCATATIGVTGGGVGGFGSGGAGGLGFFGVILAVLAAVVGLLIQSASYIVFWIVYLWFLWLAIKNSPTARTRRFTVGAALDYAVLGMLLSRFETWIQPFVAQRNFYSSDYYFWLGFMPFELRSFLIAGLPQYVVLAAFVLYVILRWRQLLYDDLTDQSRARQEAVPEAEEAENDENPWHRVFERERRLLAGAAAAGRRWRDGFLTDRGLKTKWGIVLGIIAALLLWNFCSQIGRMESTLREHPEMLFYSRISMVWWIALQIVLQTAFFRIMWHGIRMSADEQAVKAAPPKFPAPSWKTETVLESLAPERRRRLRVDALVLMAAIPLAIQLLAVGLGFVRQMPDWGHSIYLSPDRGVQTVVRFQIALVALAALYASTRPARRYAVFALLFFVSGLATFYYYEYSPLISAGFLRSLIPWFLWGLPEKYLPSPLPFWDEQRMHLFHHLMTAIGCGYLFFASAVCGVVHRVMRNGSPERSVPAQ